MTSCEKILWMKQILLDFGMNYEHVLTKYDTTSAISLSKNLILYLCVKHIDIRLHFLHDHMQKGDIMLELVCIEQQLIDIFTKSLSDECFRMIRRELRMVDMNEIN